jgi:hypothetical protein
MLSMLEKCEKILLQKYLKFTVLDDLDRSSAWLIGDEGNLSEKCSRHECSYLFSSLNYSQFALDDIVGASIGHITDSDDTLSCLSELSLTHQEEVRYLSFIETIEDVEFFDV